MLRDELNKHVEVAQEEIRAALQKLHDETGLIPVSVSFESLDVSTFEQHGKENAVKVSSVNVVANT